jgi:hypothetical protein
MGETGCLADGHFQNLEVVNTTILDTGVTTMADETESNSATTGALIVTGGVGIAGNLNVGGVTTLNGVKGAEAIIYKTSGTNHGTNVNYFFSGPMAVPGGSIIIDMGVVVTAQLVASPGHFGVRFGTWPGDNNLTGSSVAGLAISSPGTVAVGVGTSMDRNIQAALGGNAKVNMTDGEAYIPSETVVHGSVVADGGGITGGDCTFWVKYISIV